MKSYLIKSRDRNCPRPNSIPHPTLPPYLSLLSPTSPFPIPHNFLITIPKMFLYPSPDQESLSISLIQSGSTMFLGGLIVGLLVYASKYPRITLYAHIEGTSYGLSMVVIGLLIGTTKYVGKLSEWECYLVWMSQIVGWPMWLSQLCQCFWGTNQMNKIVYFLESCLHCLVALCLLVLVFYPRFPFFSMLCVLVVFFDG